MNARNALRSICALHAALVLGGFAHAEQNYRTEWITQIGTARDDFCSDLAFDNQGNIVMAGDGAGMYRSPFLAKFDRLGNVQSNQDYGGPFDRGWGVAGDALGNAYLTGETGVSDSAKDGYVTQIGPAGNVVWSRPISTPVYDTSQSVAVDRTANIYVTGHTAGDLGGPNAGSWDVYLRKYDTSGNVLWTRQIGGSGEDEAYSVAVDGKNNVYVGGQTYGNVFGNRPVNVVTDSMLMKFTPTGDLLWGKQFGSDPKNYCDFGRMTVDSRGNAYVTGSTWGEMVPGGFKGESDVYVAKFDPSGNPVWIRQLGSTEYDYGRSVAVDNLGNVYFTGWTHGDLGGSGGNGQKMFFGKFDPYGNLLWIRQLRSTNEELGEAILVNQLGEVYLGGYTSGNFPGTTNYGNCDAFLIKLAPLVSWDADPNTPGSQEGSGTWSTAHPTWWNGAANVPWSNATQEIAVFGNGGTGTANITVSETVTTSTILFNPGATYTLSGDSIRLVGTAGIVTNVPAQIDCVLEGSSGLIKSGVAELILRGNNTFTGTTSILEGTLTIAGPQGQLASSVVEVESGATLAIQAGAARSLGVVEGEGTMEVLPGGVVSANSILTDTLNIGEGATVAINLSASAATVPVPEPDVLSLLVSCIALAGPMRHAGLRSRRQQLYSRTSGG